FFFSSRRRHRRSYGDWSSDVCSSDLFERWVDAERAQLANQLSDALVTLAKEAASRGDHRAAADRWRILTAVDPLSSHAALGLMRSEERRVGKERRRPEAM